MVERSREILKYHYKFLKLVQLQFLPMKKFLLLATASAMVPFLAELGHLISRISGSR